MGQNGSNLRINVPTGATLQFLLNNGLILAVGGTGVSNYNNVATAGLGLTPIYGVDTRNQVAASDGSPLTLYAVPANGYYKITVTLNCTAFTTGSHYTLQFKNGAAGTSSVQVTVAATGVVSNTFVVFCEIANITGQFTRGASDVCDIGVTVQQVN